MLMTYGLAHLRHQLLHSHTLPGPFLMAFETILPPESNYILDIICLLKYFYQAWGGDSLKSTIIHNLLLST